MVKSTLAIACCAVAACGTFEDRNVVIDLRILAMTATPPEQIVAITATQDPTALLAQLVPAEVCALVTDPNFDRRLRFELTLCQQSGGRCDRDAPHAVIATGVIDDPDRTIPKPQLCGVIQPDRDLLEVVSAGLDEDAFRGLGGVQYGVELKIGGEEDDPELDPYGFKSLAVQPNIPADRAPNVNPTIRGLTVSVDDGPELPLELVRCAETTAPLVLQPGQTVRITPIEPEGVRETYPIPTLDGETRSFTESLTYQWVVNRGELSRGDTGGPHDRFGNPATLFTDFTAPRTAQAADISMWVIQRDERLGAAWFETCFRVAP